MTRYVARIGMLLAVLLLAGCARHAQDAGNVMRIDHAQAIRSGWNAKAPPVSGWTPVKLIDTWSTRWPHHDGVVWYRLHWNQVSTRRPVGLLVSYMCLGGLIKINGSVIYRDPSLVEPLSRSWTRPHYFLIGKPLLRKGKNTLLVRVSGLAAYLPAFGPVTVGDPAVVHAQYQREWLIRYEFQWFDEAISAVLFIIFGMIWLLRRKDTVYGWFALTTLFSMLYAYNNVAASPWPFDNTDAWQAMNAAIFVCSAVTDAIFLLRFAERRWPRTERVMLVFGVVSLVFALLAPHVMGPNRDLWMVVSGMVLYVANIGFVVLAMCSRRTDYRVLAVCILIPILASLHDYALYLGLISGDTYYMSLTSSLSMIGLGFAVAWRFTAAMRRVEGFNVELESKVDAATARLGDTLASEHALALANTRIGERLNLVRDLHDGFGGTLLGTIAALEHPTKPPDPPRIVAILKNLREDLRLVIDTTVHDDADLAGLLAPLRHRWSQRFEVAGIDSHWQLQHLDGLHLGAARSLDLLRLLQEALTNVLKHSHAARVDIRVAHGGERLQVEIRDDGHGFDTTSAQHAGAGVASLRARAARLNGNLVLDSTPGRGVTLHLDATVPDMAGAMS